MISIMSDKCLPPPFNRLAGKDTPIRNLTGGETLFVQSKAAAGLFYLVSGVIDLRRLTQAGHSVLIHRARAKQTFAEASLFSQDYHCTATAVCDSVVIECKRAAVTALLHSDIEFSNAMASQFALQIQENRRRVELLSIREADARVLAALGDGMLVDEITTFADMIGLAPETVYRALAKLTGKGCVVKTARGRYQRVAGRKL